MDSDEVLQQDVILFRQFMRVMTLLRNQHRIQPRVLPTPSISHSPSLDSGDIESQDDGSDDEDDESWESDSDSEMDEVVMDEQDDDMDNGNFNNDDSGDRDEDDDSVGTIETDELNSYSQEPQQASGLIQETTTQPPTQASSSPDPIQTTENNTDLCCWDHGCDGRRFTTLSNLRRHRRERLRTRPVWRCSRCGASFSRTTARNTHVARGSCNRIRRYSNGRRRPVPRVDD